MLKILGFRVAAFKILALGLLTSCGSSSVGDWIEREIDRRTPLPDRYIDSAFDSVVAEFKSDAKKYGVDLRLLSRLRTVKFGQTKTEQSPNAIGTCITTTNNWGKVVYTEIVINPMFKSEVETLRFKGLLYHELGHCLLQRAHVDSYPPAIMSPTLAWEQYYQDNWKELVEELFLNKTNTSSRLVENCNAHKAPTVQ